MKIHRTDHDGFYTLEAFTDDDRPISLRDGSFAIVDSRCCRNPEVTLWNKVQKTAFRQIDYSSRGIA